MPEDNERDYLGDQIGWAVRQQLPPTPQLRKIDKKIMQSLPRFLRRPIALLRFERGWLPETGNPLAFYTKTVTAWIQAYLNDYSQLQNVNTITLRIISDPIKIHSSSFTEGTKEVSVHWENQVKWAQDINQRRADGEQIIPMDENESCAILTLQNEMIKLREQLKPFFVKRGLPFPWTPSDTLFNIAPIPKLK